MRMDSRILTLVCFAFSSATFAESNTTSILKPQQNGFYATITGLNLQPGETGIGLVTHSWQYVDSSSPSDLAFRAQDKPFNPRSSWAWEIDVGYNLPCTTYNIEASYFNFNNNTKITLDSSDNPTSIASYFFTNILDPFNSDSPISLNAFLSNIKLSYRLNQGELVIGHNFFNECSRFQAKSSFGLQYINLHRNTFFDNNAIFQSTDNPIILQGNLLANITSSFNGVGPIVALDLHYNLYKSFGLAGHFGGAVAIGHINSQTTLIRNITQTSPIVLPTTVITNSYVRPSIRHVVPNTEAKIGIDYRLRFCGKSTLNLEIGYHVSDYWQAFNLIRGDISREVDLPTQRITAIETNNFFINGPYADLTFHL